MKLRYDATTDTYYPAVDVSPALAGRCHCADCRLTDDHDHGRHKLPRPMQYHTRRRRRDLEAVA